MILLFTVIFFARSCADEFGAKSKLFSGGNTSNSSPTVSLISINFFAASSSFQVGTEVDLYAIGIYSDGSQANISSEVTYSSSDESVVTVSSSKANAVSAGIAQVSATLSSQDITVASISSSGLNEAVGAGTTTIDISYGGFSTTHAIEVTSATIDSIQVTPVVGSKAIGPNQQFNATATLSDGSTLDVTESVSWSSYDTSKITINSSRLANLVASGNVDITATLDAFSSTVTFEVLAKTLSSISLTITSPSIGVDVTTSATVIATYSDASTEDISDSATITLTDNTLALVNQNSSLSLRSLNTGSVDVTASFEGQTDTQINFNWANGQAPLGVEDNFSVRWTGQIKGKYTGDCQVSSRSDDGFRIWIDGVSIIDVWFPYSPKWDHNYAIPFVEGEKQTITVEFFENGGML